MGGCTSVPASWPQHSSTRLTANLFRDKKYEEAIACYKGALALLADDPAKAVAGEEGVEDEATELATTCHCNIAACALNCATLPDNFAVAEEHCDQVLATDPKHPKALYRRGMALMGQNRLEEAEKAMHTAREVMGADDPQIVTALRQVDLSNCLLYTSPSPRDQRGSRMPSSA